MSFFQLLSVVHISMIRLLLLTYVILHVCAVPWTSLTASDPAKEDNILRFQPQTPLKELWEDFKKKHSKCRSFV